MNNDPDLRRRFEALKNDEQRLAPPFEGLFRVRATRAPRRFPRLAAATALLLILTAVPIAVRRFSTRVEQPPHASLSTWRAPTDFLLTTPNAELLRSLPEIGTTSIPLTQGVTQ
jgi:hypothetical protein